FSCDYQVRVRAILAASASVTSSGEEASASLASSSASSCSSRRPSAPMETVQTRARRSICSCFIGLVLDDRDLEEGRRNRGALVAAVLRPEQLRELAVERVGLSDLGGGCKGIHCRPVIIEEQLQEA